jgi:hypothetical protein
LCEVKAGANRPTQLPQKTNAGQTRGIRVKRASDWVPGAKAAVIEACKTVQIRIGIVVIVGNGGATKSMTTNFYPVVIDDVQPHPVPVTV